MQSGLKVRFARSCADRDRGAEDPGARVLRVETAEGELLFDRASGLGPPPDRRFAVATLETLAGHFGGAPRLADFGVFRELVADRLAAAPGRLTAARDRRWVAEPGVRLAGE
jgi:hypothetical protein